MTTTPKREPWWRELTRPPAPLVIAAFFGWWIFVAVSASGVRLGGRWDFSVTGQLGDSFGILSSLMASLAAIFTYRTLVATQHQAELAEAEAHQAREATARAERRAKAERNRAEQHALEQQARERRRDSEQTYFRLMELRNRVVGELHSGIGEHKVEGTDAAARMVRSIDSSPADHRLAFKAVYDRNENDLGHYFRTTYHVIRFANDRFGQDEAYEYVRLLRAQLSNAELILIALNCCFGEGEEKFKPYVVRYSLLHNINSHDRARFGLDQYFGARAFDPEAT